MFSLIGHTRVSKKFLGGGKGGGVGKLYVVYILQDCKACSQEIKNYIHYPRNNVWCFKVK